MPIDFSSLPLREVRKSRDLDWDPFALDFSREAADWLMLDDDEKHMLLRHVAGFLLGERAVTHDLAPLQQAIRRERGRMEEEMYLTVQQYEETRHVEFFQRWLNEALPGVFGKDIPYPDLGAGLNGKEVPTIRMSEVLHRLDTDPSPENQVRAVVAYHIIVEGVVAEVGYHIFYAMLDKDGLFPGLRKGVELIQRDEKRHVAFGVYLLQRMLAERPELEAVFDDEIETVRGLPMNGLDQVFLPFGDDVPFGLDPARFHELSREFLEGKIQAVKRGTLIKN